MLAQILLLLQQIRRNGRVLLLLLRVVLLGLLRATRRGLSTLIVHTIRTLLQRVVATEALRLQHLLYLLVLAQGVAVRRSRHFLT